ncbi:hypothetical protein E4U53_007400 [Claviceps sorghi]|nr:hypothetical protein E4U53_007400 [Claviceps sorghi]
MLVRSILLAIMSVAPALAAPETEDMPTEPISTVPKPGPNHGGMYCNNGTPEDPNGACKKGGHTAFCCTYEHPRGEFTVPRETIEQSYYKHHSGCGDGGEIWCA